MVTADTEPASVESKINWFEKHSKDRRPLWITEDENGKTIGWISFQSFYGRPAYDATAEISIYLHEGARGKGLGKKALRYAMENCNRYGIKTLLGFIFAHNVPSLKLFTSQGFEQWANLPAVAVLYGVERSLIILGKRIAK